MAKVVLIFAASVLILTLMNNTFLWKGKPLVHRMLASNVFADPKTTTNKVVEYQNIFVRHNTIKPMPENPVLPRALFLGDSISRDVSFMYPKIGTNSTNIYGPHVICQPMCNCEGFTRFQQYLTEWLGKSSWDYVQFNIGQWFWLNYRNNDCRFAKNDDCPNYQKDLKTKIREEYQDVLTWILERIRKHSPNAILVFALTTPSPLDFNETYPREPLDEKCTRNFREFAPPGFVDEINNVAREWASNVNVVIHDRNKAILPNLTEHQNPCDIHFNERGSKAMAQLDLDLMHRLLLTKSHSQWLTREILRRSVNESSSLK